MKWRSAAVISAELEVLPIVDLVGRAASLRSFFNGSLFPHGYSADEKWTELVKLTPAGVEALSVIQSRLNDSIKKPDLMMGMFRVFYHHELFIDCENTDLNAIFSILESELIEGKLRIPHRFGRLIYDKFNDEYGENRTDHMLPGEAWGLLEGTPIGVYQVGRLICGPLGVIEVGHSRYIPPSLNVALWHCSDLGCQAVHGVNLMRFDVANQSVYKDVRRELAAEFGPASEWNSALADINGRDIINQPYTYFDTCTIVADCIFEAERKGLVAAAILSEIGDSLRGVLSDSPRKKAYGQGGAEAVAARISPEEQLQLLWAIPNQILVNLIDKCVSNSSIHLPLAEIRVSHNVPPSPQGIPACELSAFGIRCSSSQPLLDCWGLIWEAYDGSNRVGELDWRLHNSTGTSSRSLLLDYLCRNDPAKVLRELVLASEPITKIICTKVGCSLDDVNESKFVDRVLWKLGFDLPRFSEHLPTLRRRLEFFNQELLAVGVLKDERDRERVRSAGVNLFVSIEAFLDLLLGYNVWLLYSDHLLETRFKYDEDVARKSVADAIGQSVGSGQSELFWMPDRTNTLGVSMAYLSAAVKWMKEILDQPRDALRRPSADLPHFADDSFRVFPFLHSALWADSDRSSLERVIDGFRNIVTKISRSNLAGIRNGLDHYRREESFPKLDEMLAFVSHFREAVDSADVNRYFPKEFWVNDSTIDRFGRRTSSFSDYQRQAHMFYGPAFFVGLPSVRLDLPAIIAPGMLLGAANSEIVFSVASKSVASSYWDGYPRRRQISNSDESADLSPQFEGDGGERGSLQHSDMHRNGLPPGMS